MTGDNFNTVSAFLTTEVQGVFKKHFEFGVSAIQIDAMVSAMAMVVGMFAAQDPVFRAVFDGALDHSIKVISGNERFQEGTAKLQAGEKAEPLLNVGLPDLWSVVSEARRRAAQAPCLHCDIRKAIIDRFGTPVTEPDDVRAIFGNLAKVVAELICDVGEEALVFFDASLVAHLESIASKRSTKGMTKQ